MKLMMYLDRCFKKIVQRVTNNKYKVKSYLQSIDPRAKSKGLHLPFLQYYFVNGFLISLRKKFVTVFSKINLF